MLSLFKLTRYSITRGAFMLSETTTEMASRRLDEHVSSWTMDTISQCLGYCRDWNTNARKAVVVHALVGSILRCVSITSLKELPVSSASVPMFLCVLLWPEPASLRNLFCVVQKVCQRKKLAFTNGEESAMVVLYF